MPPPPWTSNASNPIYVGDEFVYTVTVSKEGPGDASGVEVFDQLPSGLAFISASPSQGTYSNFS